MFILKTLLALGLTTLLAPSLATAQEVECWAPDGETLADNTTYVPCNKLGIQQEGIYSSCCNLDGRPGSRDVCTSTGLCLNGSVLTRGYCTDQNWDSPACVNVCTDDDAEGSQNGTVELTPCGDGTYCCGSSNRCCDTDRAFAIPTQSSVVASNVTETAYVTETAGSDGDVSTFRSATIGLAAVLGVVALAAIGAILWLRRKNSNLYKQLTEANAALDSAQQANNGTVMSQTPASHSVQPYQESYMGDTATNVTTSPNPQYAYYKHPAMSGTSPATPSEIDGQRYSELDATMINADRGSLMTSPMPEEHQFQQQQQQQPPRATSPRGTPAQSPTFGSSPH
jgi:hypothetical protein